MSEPVRLVLAGGGHSHIEVLRQLALGHLTTLEVTLVTREALMPYSGMLPGFIAGHYRYDECHLDLRGLAQMARARFCLVEVDGVDLEDKLAHCGDRPPIPFDLLSLNTGARPVMDDVPGAHEFAWPVKPVDAFIRRWQALVANLRLNPRAHRFVTVGGVGGVELTLSMQYALREIVPNSEFTIVSASPELVSTHNAGVRRRLEGVLATRGIKVHRSETAAEVASGEVRCASGLRIPFDILVWATQVSAAPWLRTSGLAVDGNGFVCVNNALQSTSHDFVFAAGDVASFVDGPLPKSGVYAVREAPVLARNLLRYAAGAPLLPYRPQKHHLALISTGDRNAIASRGGWSAGGAWVWRWKSRIDRRWMNGYKYIVPSFSKAAAGLVTGRLSLDEALPVNSASNEPELPAVGAGAALNENIVKGALDRLGLPWGWNGEERINVPEGKQIVNTAGFFPSLIEDEFLAGRIAAIHCLSNIYARNATPFSVTALATIPSGDSRFMEDTLRDLLAGAQSVLRTENIMLTGVHALQGEDMLFGLSVNGLLDRTQAAPAAQPGDMLLLTKPLGTAAIFAADLNGIAQNDWLNDALSVATQSNAAAARILFDHGATLCTTIAKGGLYGCLDRVLTPTGHAARLELGEIPVLAGGFHSHVSELVLSDYTKTSVTVAQSAAFPMRLLYDAETSGGFAAAVPQAHADACLGMLHASGYAHAARIGSICEREQDSGTVSF